VQVEVYERDLTAIRGEGKYRGPIQVGCHRGCWRAGRSGAAHGAASAAAQRRTPPPANASRHRHTPELPGPRPRWKSISPRMLSCAAGRTGGCSGRMPPGGGAGCWRAHGLGHQTAASARPPGPTGAIQRPGSAGGHRPLLRPQGHGGGLHHGRPHQRPVRWRVRRLVGGPTPRWRRARTLVGYQPPSQPASAQVKPRLRARTLDARGAEQLPGRRARVAPVPPPLPLGIVPSHGASHSAPGCPPPPPPRRYVKFDTFHPAVDRGLPVTRVISRVTLQASRRPTAGPPPASSHPPAAQATRVLRLPLPSLPLLLRPGGSDRPPAGRQPCSSHTRCRPLARCRPLGLTCVLGPAPPPPPAMRLQQILAERVFELGGEDTIQGNSHVVGYEETVNAAGAQGAPLAGAPAGHAARSRGARQAGFDQQGSRRRPRSSRLARACAPAARLCRRAQRVGAPGRRARGHG
jgi:hypothetical protein